MSSVLALSFPLEQPPLMTSIRYRVFGLTVESEIVLPDLTPADDQSAVPDVVIATGAISRTDDSEPIGLSVTPGGAILNIPEAGRYRVTGGNRIQVEPAADATDRSVRRALFRELLARRFGR